ncbi:MAG: cobalamin biosynthesis protein CbiX [Burkholderiaceae bacterium]|nr:cobalamin biosynthesis protein CbiX [Burkholderiaceae bacterium]
MHRTGILLLAHGSRDPKWRAPFESIEQITRDAASGPVIVSFLESMQPDFIAGVRELAGQAVEVIRVVPVFLAAGAHLRQDLPKLVEEAQSEFPGLTFQVLPAIGETEEIQRSIARYAVGAGP